MLDSRRSVKGKSTASGAHANGDRDSSLAIVPGDPTAPNSAVKNASYVAHCLRCLSLDVGFAFSIQSFLFDSVLFFEAAAAAVSLDSSGAAPARRPPNHETDQCGCTFHSFRDAVFLQSVMIACRNQDSISLSFILWHCFLAGV